MIIIMKPGSTEADIDDVCRRVADFGFRTHLSRGEVRTIIGVVGDDRAKEQLLALQALDAVEGVVRILQPFKLASREAHPESTQFKIGDVPVVVGAKGIVHKIIPQISALEKNAHDATKIIYEKPLCLVIGSEGTGVSKDILNKYSSYYSSF